MRETGSTIKQMDKAYLYIIMALDMKENGRTISRMGLAQKLGLMAQDTQEITTKAKSMEREY